MNTNPAALLALISDLYEQAAALQAENAQLREALAEREQPASGPVPMPTWDANGPSGTTA